MNITLCMGQSIKVLYREQAIIMFPVPYVLHLLDQKYVRTYDPS